MNGVYIPATQSSKSKTNLSRKPLYFLVFAVVAEDEKLRRGHSIASASRTRRHGLSGDPPPPPSAAACSAKKKEKVIVFSGPTGAGKRRFSLESADSVQVYRGLDVGPTKPSFGERKEVPHHLVDILHPSEEYSVGQFFEDARQATRDILNNGRVPIIMGGTGVILTMVRLGKNGVEEVLGVRLRKTRTGKSQTRAQIFY